MRPAKETCPADLGFYDSETILWRLEFPVYVEMEHRFWLPLNQRDTSQTQRRALEEILDETGLQEAPLS